MTNLCRIIILLFCVHSSFAQTFQRFPVPISQNEKEFSILNVGGLKNPQFSNIDFNGDGVQDLFIFDRSGDVVIPMVKIGDPGTTTFRYAPEYLPMFPKLQAWALLGDFNGDGLKDIFTSSASLPNCCIEVWKAKEDTDGKLFYDKVTFENLPFRDILQFGIGGSHTNIYVSPVDLPAIADVDNDGDLDIISFEPDGSYASFFKNVAIEQGYGNDTMIFVREDICWGKFAENQYNEQLSLSNSPYGCATPLTGGTHTGLRHSGSTMAIFDLNGDGLKDLLIGDLDSPNLAKMINGGEANLAWMTELELNFPQDDVPVDLGSFISPFYVDADGDGIRDLIVTPNDVNVGENDNHIWFYKNIGTDSYPIFRLQQKDFLIDQMPHFYGGTHPAFADINGDGLVDIVLGISHIQKKELVRENRLILLLNNGTKDAPSYYVADEDYLSFSANKETPGRLAPFFGDLDGDGKPDLLIGDGFGQIFFYKNKADAGQPVDFEAPIYPYFDIFTGQNAKPIIIDLDGDGLNDMVVGKKNNELNFFKNIGTVGHPIFNPAPEAAPNIRQLGNIFTGNNFSTQNGAPAFITDGDRRTLLFMGSEAAGLRSFVVNDDIHDNFLAEGDYRSEVKEGSKLTPSFADIDNDGYYEMVIGNERGGISFYKTDIKVGKPSATKDVQTQSDVLKFYPNPATESIFVSCDLPKVQLTLSDITGSIIFKLNNYSNNTLPDNLQPGIYFITARNQHAVITEKLVIGF